jgi:hypothetical protein
MFAAMIIAFAFLAALQSALPFTSGALESGNRFCTLSGRYFDKSVLIRIPPICSFVQTFERDSKPEVQSYLLP